MKIISGSADSKNGPEMESSIPKIESNLSRNGSIESKLEFFRVGRRPVF
jgi:hypothetical protein